MGLFSLWRRRGRPKVAPARLLDHPILRELPLSDPGGPGADVPAPLAPASPRLPDVREAAPSPPAPPAHEDIRGVLLAAAAANDEERLACLCRDHEAVLREHLRDWLEVPADLRSNPEAVRWYAEGVRAVVRFCAERLDRPDLLGETAGDAPPAAAPMGVIVMPSSAEVGQTSSVD